jgi:hypothetical protein
MSCVTMEDYAQRKGGSSFRRIKYLIETIQLVADSEIYQLLYSFLSLIFNPQPDFNLPP